QSGTSGASRLEQLDGIAIRIFNLNLFPARALLHFISEAKACRFKLSNAPAQIIHLKQHAVPVAGLLMPAIGHWPGPRCAWAAQDQLEAVNRYLAERRQVLHVQLEAQRVVQNTIVSGTSLTSHPPADRDALRTLTCPSMSSYAIMQCLYQ